MNPTSIPRSDAQRMLAEVDAVRAQTRDGLRGLWFPMIVYGALLMLSAPFFSVWDGAAVGLFWLVAAAAGTVLVQRHYCERALSIGAHPATRPYVVTSVVLVAACFLLGGLGGALGAETLAAVGPPLAISVAYVVFAWLDRSIAPALLAVLLAGLAIALAIAGTANPGPILALAYGASFLALGLLLRSTGRSA